MERTLVGRHFKKNPLLINVINKNCSGLGEIHTILKGYLRPVWYTETFEAAGYNIKFLNCRQFVDTHTPYTR